MNQDAIKEVLKSVGRALYFGLLGVVALVLTVIIGSPEVAQASIVLPYLDITLNVGTAIVAGAAALAKIVDRYRHTNLETDSNGIAPGFLQG